MCTIGTADIHPPSLPPFRLKSRPRYRLHTPLDYYTAARRASVDLEKGEHVGVLNGDCVAICADYPTSG